MDLKRTNPLALSGGLGLLAGLLSYASVRAFGGFDFVESTEGLVPGALFGAAVAIYVFVRGGYVSSPVNWLRILFLLVLSSGAYWAAVRSTVKVVERVGEGADTVGFDDLAVSLFAGGAAGGFVVALAVWLFFARLSPRTFVFSVIASGILGQAFVAGLWASGISGPVALDVVAENISGAPLLFLLVLWQTGMAMVLGNAYDRSSKLITFFADNSENRRLPL